MPECSPELGAPPLWRRAVRTFLQRYRWHLGVCISVMVFAFAVALGAWFSRPYPVRVFLLHRSALSEYIEEINGQCIDSGSGGSPYSIPAGLRRCGISRVFCVSGRFYFYFESLPPDSIEELVWSNDGNRGLQLPSGSSGENLVLELRRLDREWFYMRSE